MSTETTTGRMPGEEQELQTLSRRNQRGRVGEFLFRSANIFAIVALIIIGLTILNSAFGYVILHNTVDPATLSEKPLEELTEAELITVLQDNIGGLLRVIVRDNLSVVPAEVFTTTPLGEVLAGRDIPDAWKELTINDLNPEQLTTILRSNMDAPQLYDIVLTEIVKPVVIESWQLFDSIFNAGGIQAEAAEKYPNDTLEFRSWVSLDFLTSSASSSPTTAGLRTALLGSALIILFTAPVAFFLGVGAAIYLEEYADRSPLNTAIEINIRNLAAVPSIIYGLLGLTVFVRTLGGFTSGAAFGITDSNGRTVISAALTLALLILPVIIINAQEAIRAVPRAIRDASYGLGATRWQTVSRQVLPLAMPGILTGVILSMSRAVGETAPLIVVGASTFIAVDPTGPFSKFTVVPIQIYQWTSNPDQEFRNVAAAAIVVLLIVMLLLNGSAIVLRNRFGRMS